MFHSTCPLTLLHLLLHRFMNLWEHYWRPVDIPQVLKRFWFGDRTCNRSSPQFRTLYSSRFPSLCACGLSVPALCSTRFKQPLSATAFHCGRRPSGHYSRLSGDLNSSPRSKLDLFKSLPRPCPLIIYQYLRSASRLEECATIPSNTCVSLQTDNLRSSPHFL